MRKATDSKNGEKFLLRSAKKFAEPENFQPRKIIQGVGRGYHLISNARKWTKPQAGSGSDRTVLARGQQWRIVMAYAGFEIFAASMQGNFTRDPKAKAVSTFLDGLGDYSNRLSGLPKCRCGSAKQTVYEALEFLSTYGRDRAVLENWFSSDASKFPKIEISCRDAVSLARVIRNLTAHGVLSATYARKFAIPELCADLTEILFETAVHSMLLESGENPT